jgi:hypothetical protein
VLRCDTATLASRRSEGLGHRDRLRPFTAHEWFGRVGATGVVELFGNRADFAIEAGVEPDLQPPSAVWGHMRVWCRGVPLGDITDRHCALYPAYTLFRWLPSHLGELWAPELVGLDDSAAWNFLDRLLYGGHGDGEPADGRTAEQRRADWRAWNRFDFLTNRGEQFDGYKAFILSPPGDSARILSRHLPESMFRGVRVSKRGVVAAAEGFARWFEGEALRLEGDAAELGAAPDRGGTS